MCKAYPVIAVVVMMAGAWLQIQHGLDWNVRAQSIHKQPQGLLRGVAREREMAKGGRLKKNIDIKIKIDI